MLSSGDQGSFPGTWITEEKMGPAGLGGIVAAVSEAVILFSGCSGWPFEASRVAGVEGA